MDMAVVGQVLKVTQRQEEVVEDVYPAFDLMAIEEDGEGVWDLKGRNSKTPKKSNHGARPCSSVMRKLKKQGWYKKITAVWHQ